MEEKIIASLKESIKMKEAIQAMAGQISRAADFIIECIRAGGKVIIFGNGGSAADAQHMAAELVGRFEADHGAVPAISLTTNTSILTALANDYGYDQVFSRQIQALARPGDVVVGISTSGLSPNVLEAITLAGRIGARTLALTGEDGGDLAGVADLCLKVPSKRTARIQEGHVTVIHLICEQVENALLGGNS